MAYELGKKLTIISKQFTFRVNAPGTDFLCRFVHGKFTAEYTINKFHLHAVEILHMEIDRIFKTAVRQIMLQIVLGFVADLPTSFNWECQNP